MKRLLRWIGRAIAVVLVLGIVAYAVAYFMSERLLRRTYPIADVSVAVPADPNSIAEGQRLATVRGCFYGCHGKNAEGRVLFDDPMIARLVAPNLTTSFRQYTDAQIALIVRKGIRPDGRPLMVMPAEVFGLMTDEDLGQIIAFLKSLAPVAGPGPEVSFGPLGRIGLAVGQFKTVPQLIADALPPPEGTSEQGKFGRYLARTTCAQCHGTDLRGTSNPAFASPNLRVVLAYSPEAFTALMRTGVALGDRKLEEMGGWARNNLSHFTDAEIAALYSYLHDEAPQN
jgi:mono/diheme cytochrome c family protein